MGLGSLLFAEAEAVGGLRLAEVGCAVIGRLQVALGGGSDGAQAVVAEGRPAASQRTRRRRRASGVGGSWGRGSRGVVIGGPPGRGG